MSDCNWEREARAAQTVIREATGEINVLRNDLAQRDHRIAELEAAVRQSALLISDSITSSVTRDRQVEVYTRAFNLLHPQPAANEGPRGECGHCNRIVSVVGHAAGCIAVPSDFSSNHDKEPK